MTDIKKSDCLMSIGNVLFSSNGNPSTIVVFVIEFVIVPRLLKDMLKEGGFVALDNKM